MLDWEFDRRPPLIVVAPTRQHWVEKHLPKAMAVSRQHELVHALD